MRRPARVALLLAVALTLVLSGCVAIESPGGPRVDVGGGTQVGDFTVTILRVVDGDTLKVAYENGTEDTVRLVGVDTPEVHTETTPDEFEGVPDSDAGRSCLRRWGDRASSFSTEQVSGDTVALAFDENLDRRGYYGRLLAYVIVDGRSLNRRLIAEGYARVYDSEFSRRTAYLDAEATARESGTGLWECATEDPPTGTGTGGGGGTPTASTSGLVIAEIHANAKGPDNENLNDEYVVLSNRGESALDLSGWTLDDETGKTYVFPHGARLPAGASVTVHTGSGGDSDSDRYWDRDGAVWNNDGDTVTVRDAAGNVVVRKTYGG